MQVTHHEESDKENSRHDRWKVAEFLVIWTYLSPSDTARCTHLSCHPQFVLAKYHEYLWPKNKFIR